MEEIIHKIELFCQKEKISHRLVGGVSFGGLLNSKTSWKIDIQKHTVQLVKNTSLDLMRSDHTVKDIDIILVTTDYLQKEKLRHFIITIQNEYPEFPSVSIEMLKEKKHFHSLFQFVTTIILDQQNNPSLIFDTITEKITWESLASWHVVLDSGVTFSVRNPIADYYAYQFRSPSGVKQKDMGKIVLLKKLAEDVIRAGKKEKIDYMTKEYYLPWETYTHNLRSTKESIVVMKKNIMTLYWNTIGTSLAHESGFFGKLFASLSDKFTG